MKKALDITGISCPLCHRTLVVCQIREDKIILACNNEGCVAGFIYIYLEEDE